MFKDNTLRPWDDLENFIISSDNKLTTNHKQTGNKNKNKVATNRQQIKQTANKLATNRKQTGVTTDNSIRQQTDNIVTTKNSFSSLVGLQRSIMIKIYEICKASRTHITDPLTLEFIAGAINTDTRTIKTSLQRLEKKLCLIRVGFKNGRGGWSKYQIPDSIYAEMLSSETDNKLLTNWQQIENKLVSQPTTNHSSSSSINNITTTTDLGIEWKNIDISPYGIFGFGEGQLKQIANLNCISPNDLENSLIEFLHDYENKGLPTIKTSPLNYFIGIIRRGIPYTSPTYQTALQAELKLNADRATKRKQEELKNRVIIWAESLPQSEIKRLLSPPRIIDFDIHGFSDPVIGELMTHYVKIVNPDLGR